MGVLVRTKRMRLSLILLLCSGLALPLLGEGAPNPSKVFLGIASRYEPKGDGGRELVLGVTPNSPADRGGVKEGDWILGLNGKRYTARSLSALIDSMGWIEPGKPLQLNVLRQGRELVLELVPEQASSGQQTSLLSFLDDCRRKPEGCNELCSEEAPVEALSLRQLAEENGEVVLTFGADLASGEPVLLRSDPTLFKGWDFRADPIFSDGEVLRSIRSLLKGHSEVKAVYKATEPGRFSLALKI